MKKKSPPYAIFAAALVGVIFLVILFKWKQSEEQKITDADARARADMQSQIDALKTNQQAVVTPTPANMRNVLYATQPVDPGIKISAAFFEKKLTPNDVLPDAYTADSDIVGFYAIRKIEKGDPLTPRNIGKSLPYMSQRISPGMRALSLPIFNSDVNDTGGFIVDGDRVDLLFSDQSEDLKYILDTQIVMQNLNVLYVPGPQIKTDKTDGINPAPPPGDQISVTFEVTPEQAQALVFLTQVKNGRFSMILRARKDNSEIKIKPYTADDANSLSKLQRKTDASIARVQALAAQIEAAEKTQGQGTTNETPNPTPPSP